MPKSKIQVFSTGDIQVRQNPHRGLFYAMLVTMSKGCVKFDWHIHLNLSHTTQKMKLSIKDFFSNCDLIRRKLWIWSHLLKKSFMENLIFCAVSGIILSSYPEVFGKIVRRIENISKIKLHCRHFSRTVSKICRTTFLLNN